MKILPFEKSCASNPELVKIWHTQNEFNPEQVYLKSCIKIKWNCFTCNHTYDQTVKNKNRNKFNCPYCAIPSKILCDNDNCEKCFNKSCASNKEYMKIWNDEINPRQVFLISGTKINWKCNICKHIYTQTPHHKKEGKSCPYCAIPNKILCDNIECLYCFNKSCASNECFMKIWEDQLNPRLISISTGYLILWKCNKCSHTYKQSPDNKHKNQDCPYCANQKLCDNEKCKDCFYKSCASNENMVKIWGNKLNPRNIFLKSNVKINWKCLKCNNNYNQTPSNKSNGRGCPNCKNKTEKIVIEFLQNKNINIKHQFQLNYDTKKYDILCLDYNIIIEIDGGQHFKDMKFFKSTVKENQENDKNKMVKAMEQGYSFIRIFQEDIWNDKIDWQNLILYNLKIISKPTVLYFSSIETLYDNHQLEC